MPTGINFLICNFSVVANKNIDGLLSSPKEYRTCQHLAKEGPRNKPLCRGGNNAKKNKQRGSATNRPGDEVSHRHQDLKRSEEATN